MMKRIPRTIWGLLALLALAGCMDLVQVQRDYVADRNECHAQSEAKQQVYSPPQSYAISAKDKNTVLLQVFCECMKGHEWKVTGCPKTKEKEVAATPPREGILPATTSAAPAAPATAPPPSSQSTVVVVQAPPASSGASTIVVSPTAPAKKKPAARKPDTDGTQQLQDILNK
jgi:hypothetical protein